MGKNKKLLLVYYGDDFTGATDALEFLSRAGAKTALFIQPPTQEQLSKYPDLQAIGVAGNTRSLSPDSMEEVLVPALKALKSLGVRHVHYKVCSTFDSSPTVGSIGRAIDVGAGIFQNRFVPLLVAAPALGRYCLFGNLFAKMGIGTAGKIYRIDKHPSMRNHPVTPTDESDLCLHLARQTTKKVGLIDILQIHKSTEELNKIVEDLVAENINIILIDALKASDLLPIGQLIDGQATNENTLFSVGSSGIVMALGKFWKHQQVLSPVDNWPNLGKAAPLLVISGSCSPVTVSQINWAKERGFEEVVIDGASICKNQNVRLQIREAIEITAAYLLQHKSVIVHTNGGFSNSISNLSSEKLGTALGEIAKGAIATTGIKRLVVAGGDTSTYAARAMGVESVEMICPLVAGAPLCRATATGSPLDGKEINFKGGQVGAANYFGILLEGKLDFYED